LYHIQNIVMTISVGNDAGEIFALLIAKSNSNQNDIYYMILDDGELMDEWLRYLNGTDLANLNNSIALMIPLTYLDTDVTLTANSDVKIATQKAVKAYIAARNALDAKLSGGNSFSGNQNIGGELAVYGVLTVDTGDIIADGGNVDLKTTGKVVNLKDGTASGDGINKGQLDSHNTSSTAHDNIRGVANGIA